MFGIKKKKKGWNENGSVRSENVKMNVQANQAG